MALNSRALLWAVYAAVPLVALQYLLRKTITVEVEVGGAAAKDTKGQEEEGQEDGEEDGMTVVDDEDATFVSLQYPKKLPKVFYKQSDPEWQEFMKFSHDRERQAAIKSTSIKVYHSRTPLTSSVQRSWQRNWRPLHQTHRLSIKS